MIPFELKRSPIIKDDRVKDRSVSDLNEKKMKRSEKSKIYRGRQDLNLRRFPH